MKKLFGETKITWKCLIILSIIIGVVVGILNRIPILNNTSFQDIAVVLDMWIILAIFIIVNCKSWKEAVAKCFIFFLISQPLIYFTEILIDTFIYGADFVEKFTLYFRNYYIGAGWLTWTFLTIPGAFIAYQVKKDNILSAIILSVATCFLSFAGAQGMYKIIANNSAYHLLNSLICLSMAYILIFTILKNKKCRWISVILTTISAIAGIITLTITSNNPIVAYNSFDFEEGINMVEARVEDENIANVTLEEDGTCMTVSSSKEIGTTKIFLIDADGNEYIYLVNSTHQNFTVDIQQ